jgi:hypothetical protein
MNAELNPETLPIQFSSFDDIVDNAHLGYTKLSYHNFDGHIQEILRAIPGFCEFLEHNGVLDVPKEALKATMANHDYEVHMPLVGKKAAADEVHSALDLGAKLIQFSDGQSVLSLCIQGVIATTPNLKPRNNFDQATRILDTINVCSEDFKHVITNTLNVFVEEELELKSRKTESYIEKRDKVAGFLKTFYFNGRVEFIAVDGSKINYEPVEIGSENVKRLASLSEKQFIELIPEAEDKFALIWPRNKIY